MRQLPGDRRYLQHSETVWESERWLRLDDAWPDTVDSVKKGREHTF